MIRQPQATDGRAVKALIDSCPPLDSNSLYCNLLQCTHFAATCALAEVDGRPVGFASGYLVPDETPHTLFIWQVAIAGEARGQGLGRRLILDILGRPGCAQVSRIETTIGPDNMASWGLFESLARRLGAKSEREVMFDRHKHFAGEHDSEIVLRIAPIVRNVRDLDATNEVA